MGFQQKPNFYTSRSPKSEPISRNIDFKLSQEAQSGWTTEQQTMNQ